MTDRHAGYIIVLGEDIREDDAAGFINALHQLRGVVGVEPVVSDAMLAVAHVRARSEIVGKLTASFRDILAG